MTGFTNYTADNNLNWVAGLTAQPTLPSVWLALFTAVGTDAGTGFTEVSGGSYARVQIAGNATTNGTTASGNATLHFASTPAWIVAGMTVYDATTPASIPAGITVLSTTGTTVVMSANAAGAGVGGTDVINFSTFPAGSGTAPSSSLNGSIIAFPQATANWGTVIAWGLYDASSSGNLTFWDFMGNYSWLPFESTAVATGNGPVFSAKGNSYANNDPLVATVEYGGTFPTLSVGTLTGYNVFFAANVATDSFTACTTSGPTTAFAASTTGSGMVRKITQQSIPINVTASFAASSMTLTVA